MKQMAMQKILDIEQAGILEQYLLDSEYDLPDTVASVDKLSGGVSNRAVVVRFANGEAWVVKQALEKLRVQVDWFSSPTRILQEALGLRWCAELTPPNTVPSLMFEDKTHHILGMQAIRRPHANWKTLLLDGQLVLDHVEAFGHVLAAIHTNAYRRHAELVSLFSEYNFFETLRLEPYYQFTANQLADASDFLEQLIADTRLQRITLVHGDYSPKNVLIYNNQLILLDYEVIHWGDPAFDIGFSITHLLSKAHYLPDKRQQYAHASQHYWQTYWQAVEDMPWKSELPERAVRHTIACLLARVAGRSPLEYFSQQQRDRQQRIVIQAIQETLFSTVPALIDYFITMLEQDDSD